MCNENTLQEFLKETKQMREENIIAVKSDMLIQK